jgi:hypothetical protein
MSQYITGIDHALILVRSLDAAKATMERLGFTVSPRGYHSPHMGTANHTIMLRDDYFELLGIAQPTEHNKHWRARLARREGLGAIALRTPDARMAAGELRAAGIAAGEPIDFSRPVELPGGTHGEASFTTCALPEDAMPGIPAFVCGHHTRELVWLPTLQRHANTAVGLASLTVLVADPAGIAASYRRMFGTKNVSGDDQETAVQIGSTPVRFLTAARLAARYPGLVPTALAPPAMIGLGIAVADPRAVEARLKSNGVSTKIVSGGLCVIPDDASGVVFEFRSAAR